MCLAHNVILRNLNAIYIQAPNISLPADISAFIFFCKTWHSLIHHHHALEETYFFTSVEEYTGVKGIMEKTLKQHEAFHDGLEEFEKYVSDLNVEDWDAKKLLAIIDGFGEPLMLHLQEEIGSILALDKYGEKKLLEAWALTEKKGVEQVNDKSRELPMVFGGIDRTFEGGKHKYWPPIPWFVPYLCKYFFMGKYKGSWKFSPCDVFGQPRELPFAEAEHKEAMNP